MEGPLYTLIRSQVEPSPKQEDRLMNGCAGPLEEIEYAIEYDKNDFFLTLMGDPDYKEHVSRIHTTEWLFIYDAVNCVKSVLNGETAGVLEFTADAVPLIGDYPGEVPILHKKSVLNGETAGVLEFTADAVPPIWDNPEEVPILHKAAHFGSPLITNFCLPGNGSQVNLRIDVAHMKGALPLNLALQYIRECTELVAVFNPSVWTSDTPEEPDQLVAWILFRLICYSRIRYALEVVRLLAPKTLEIKQEFVKLLKERKLPELAALLMVARENVMPGLEGHLKIRDFVQKEIAELEILMFGSAYDIDNDKLILEAQKKKMEMEAILVFLQVFESIGDKIAAYLRLSPDRDSKLEPIEEVTLLLKEAGLDMEFEIVAEAFRQSKFCDYLEIATQTHEGPKFQNTKNEMSGCGSKKATGEYEKDMTSDEAAGFEPSSTLWLRNKQRLLENFKSLRDPTYYSSKSYHTYHPARAIWDLGSTKADKVNGLALKSHLKKQDCGKSGGIISRGCSSSWGSNLQFNRCFALSPSLSMRIIWVTRKLALAL